MEKLEVEVNNNMKCQNSFWIRHKRAEIEYYWLQTNLEMSHHTSLIKAPEVNMYVTMSYNGHS